MYQGFGKGDGGIVGGIAGEDDESDFSEICESASAEESFVCRGINDVGEEANMMFSARLCRESGDVIWIKEESENSIMERTVGMSQMTSMLHDKDRNDVYERALRASIASFQKSHNRDPIVFDIGTGTGLLSMFASRHGAEFVLGCEMFEAMATIAEEVISINNLSDKISVIPMKSSSIESIAPLRPDIVVSELLDSALLGEGCMFSHADAIKRFMDEKKSQSNDSDEFDVLSPISQRVMPYSAQVFATLISSEETKHMHDVSKIKLHGLNPFRNESARNCPGGWPLIPVQWREIASRGGRLLSDPQEILNFEFFHTFKDESETSGDDNEKMEHENEPYAFGEGCYETEIPVTSTGVTHSIMLWWKVHLLSPEIDPEREVWYTTKPDVMNWQGVFLC
jgi:predicted RNA methylase